MVHGDVELIEKLGRNDPCPCGSRRRFSRIAACDPAALTASNGITIFRDRD
ncbi:SEC-C metal-binding domain-containing protein [Rhizobium sp. BT03]|uniref:SEC-C metal-binding domain-containing protein n=1 Tax=Rhizobium sp. BT03 TaxID=3045156 RepID=UPI0034E96377